MQCERCTKKKATIFYRENISGRVRALRLCSDCADILEQAGELEDMCDPLSGTLFPLFPAEGGKFQLPFRRISVASSRGTVKKCPLCEMTFGEICDGGLLGCSQCYTVFAEEMGEVVTIPAKPSAWSVNPAAARPPSAEPSCACMSPPPDR